jgi:ParB-like chromosome segregation protein Spo0J
MTPTRLEHEVPFDLIHMDRVPWLQDKTLEYARLIREGVRFPAIRVALRLDGTYEIRDGRHRWAAGQLAGRDTIPVRHSTQPLQF